MHYEPPPPPPVTVEELLARARGLGGRSLAELAARQRIAVPTDPRRAKGWVGLVLEQALGATAGARAEPDFPALGVEMKTLPVDEQGRPKESTYVCTAPLDGSLPRRFDESWPARKLRCVLWVPILSPARASLGQRRVGTAFLWRPDEGERALLAQDYQELLERIDRGEMRDLVARHGRALQLRPKGAHGEDWTWALDEEGEWVQTSPRGFYLRASFTRALLERHLLLPAARSLV